MNTSVTMGMALMPPAFADGLTVWSSGDGTAGSDTYAGSGNGSLITADADFGGCLEVVKSDAVARVRYMGVTPVLRGCYLRVTARVKAVSGPLPSVRIGATPIGGSGAQHGGSVALTGYGDIVEVSAIIGTGNRNGVDMVWPDATGAHVGVDLTGSVGGVVRVDDIRVQDVTNVYLRDMMGLVDVRDFGAMGDGTTDDSAAFEAADAAAGGREVLVSAGTYHLAQDVTIQSQIRFEGRLTMPSDKKFIMQRNFDFATYADAFGDEEEALKRAFQALLNFSDHAALDLGGRRVGLTKPLDMQAAEGTRTTFETRRVIQNGEIFAIPGAAWENDVVTSAGTYDPAQPTTLRNVTNVANIPVGALVEGSGVGREVYVQDRNLGAQTLTLSAPLHDAEGTQPFTFTRFKYLLDFSGFQRFSRLVLTNLQLQCSGVASGVMLAPSGQHFTLTDVNLTRPRNRGLTSIGRGCQNLLVDRCEMISDEGHLPAQNRVSIAFNANANDVKIRDSRVVRFRHFCVLGGRGTVLTGNHWFLGDDEADAVRLGGIIFTSTNPKTMITGNHIDNNFIEWTNEHEADPAMGSQYSFGGLTMTGNVFTASNVANWFRWVMIKPYGPGHFLHGLSVTGNVFRTINATIDRIEDVDTSIADLDRNRFRNVVFDNNVFHGITTETRNPYSAVHSQPVDQQTWLIQTSSHLPFGGWARTVEAIVPMGPVTDASGGLAGGFPAVNGMAGGDKSAVSLTWAAPVKGDVRIKVRADNPN